MRKICSKRLISGDTNCCVEEKRPKVKADICEKTTKNFFYKTALNKVQISYTRKNYGQLLNSVYEAKVVSGRIKDKEQYRIFCRWARRPASQGYKYERNGFGDLLIHS